MPGMVTMADHGDTADTTDPMDIMAITERDLLMLSPLLMLNLRLMLMLGTDTMAMDTDHGVTLPTTTDLMDTTGVKQHSLPILIIIVLSLPTLQKFLPVLYKM